MPPPIGPTFSTLLASTAKPFVIKTIGPLSSSAAIRQQQQHNYHSKPPVVTESAILKTFPRPNLEPTLINLQKFKSLNSIQATCVNCFGPHSTEFCPC
jgi:hypothetical protein